MIKIILDIGNRFIRFLVPENMGEDTTSYPSKKQRYGPKCDFQELASIRLVTHELFSFNCNQSKCPRALGSNTFYSQYP